MGKKNKGSTETIPKETLLQTNTRGTIANVWIRCGNIYNSPE